MSYGYDSLRLMADDMTGALDSAAGLVGAFGPLAVGIRPEEICPVLDTNTREARPQEAAARVAGWSGHLAPQPARLSFLKLDSLLRGHAGAELAALVRALSFARVVIAPALPAQGRITRGGRQHWRVAGTWQPTGEDLAARLAAEGLAPAFRQPGDPALPGLSLFDAKTDAELDQIVRAVLEQPAPSLWVGSGGLAAALGRALGGRPPARPALPAPLLGLVGTDHPVMRGQMAGLPDRPLELSDHPVEECADLVRQMGQQGRAFACCRLPAGLDRPAAQRRIAAIFGSLVVRMPRPGTLFVSGGETLRGLMAPLGVERIEVIGEWETGAPISRLAGGRWAGLPLVSKSGAFGAPDFLARLVATLQPSAMEPAP
ncbi:MAG: hypothetical protein O9333_07085 [Beijerinckiaceae bacterium]|jgi:uncharacterized protein YgbK (DUF1537 family)|nr:hypothetical protein [Beijerinckiaceae bacterium]